MPALTQSLTEALAAMYSTSNGLLQRSDPADGTISGRPNIIVYSHATVIGYIVGSCAPLSILTYLFYRRIRRVRLKDLPSITYIRSLVYLNYIVGIAFCIVALVTTTTGLNTFWRCENSIYICIGFLFLSKGLMQLFLVERAHVANINYVRRRDDPVWLCSMAAVCILGSAVTILTYLNPVAYISNVDGFCHKGLPPRVVAPIEAFDIVLNTILTAVFVTMLRRTRQCEIFPPELIHEPRRLHRWYKLVRSKTLALLRLGKDDAMSSRRESSDELNPADSVVLPPSTQPSRLHGLARKSLLGTLLILIWALINSSIFYATKGREMAWLCFTQCTLDVFLAVCVLHWLTSEPKHDENKTRASLNVTFSSLISRRSMSVVKGEGSIVHTHQIDISHLGQYNYARNSMPDAEIKLSFADVLDGSKWT